jgi:predicted ABC-type ATPase
MKIAEELKTVAVQLMPRIVMTVDRADGVENSAYNSVHYEVARFLDTVRRNEGLTTVLSRVDADDSMRLEVGFTDHEAAEAIERELVKKTSSACARNGIDAVRVGYAEEGKDAKESATNITFTDETSNRIWGALKEMGVVAEGPTAGNIRWQAVFFIGPAGSGKSFVRNLRYVKHLDFKVVDPDEIKKRHPDYDPDAPFKVHAWSKKISEGQFKNIVEKGDGAPVIVDGTGRNIEGILRKMKAAKASGYKTYIVYVYVPFEISIFRNRNRTRFVPEDIIVEQSGKIRKNFATFKSQADKAKVIPNFEKPELATAKQDIKVYPVPQKVRPPRPGDPDYGVEPDAIAASLVDIAESLTR